MKILDLYIIKKVLKTFVFVVLILVAIVVVIDMAEKTEKFASSNLTTSEIIGYYLDYMPWIGGLITPITAFIAVVYITSIMASHTEIVAILSSGVSFRRFLVPYLIAGVVIAGVSFFLNGWIIPKSNQSRLAFELQYLKSRTFDRRNIHLQLEPSVYLHMENFNNLSNTGYQVILERFNGSKLVEKVTASNITWDSTTQKWKLHTWQKQNIDRLFQTRNPEHPEEINTYGDEMDTTLAIVPNDFEVIERQYDGMTINELKEYIAKLKARGRSGIEYYEVEEQFRYASPFTILILVFMGVIVSSRKNRGGTGFQISLGFMLSFVFILFFTMSRTFAETGSLSPAVAVWMPNAIFALVSIGLLRYAPR